MSIKVRGIEYHYKIHQKKNKLPNVVFLHGFMGSGNSFQELIKSAKAFCNPITIDLLGHGKTEGSEMHYRFSSREQSSDLIKLISEQLTTPLFLYGYSMGGRLALSIALQRTDLFQGLILESTTFGIENEQERQARQVLDSRRADSILSNFELFLEEWKDLPIFKKTKEHAVTAVQKSQDPLWMSNSLLGFGTGTMPCFKEQLTNLSMPVLMFAGKEDSKFVNIMGSMNKLIPHSELKVIDESHHRLHIEKPLPIAEHLKEFLSKNTLP